MSALLWVPLFALLFALFGLLRPADAAGRGCHNCSSNDGSCEQDGVCPLLQDLVHPTGQPGEER